MHAYLVPALESLFDEFNRLAPNRDKASDGAVADQAHRERVSDHNIDDGPDQGATPYEDDDSTPEVHAADVDANLRHATATMQLCCNIIADRHRRGVDNRLQNIIFNGRIASRSWGWTWQTYTGSSDPHTGHAHFGCRYTTAQERDTRPWGLLERFEDEMDQETFTNYLRKAVQSDATIRKELAEAVWTTDNVVNINDPAGPKDAGGQSLVRWGDVRATEARDKAGAAYERANEAVTIAQRLEATLATVLERLPAPGGDTSTTSTRSSTAKSTSKS